MSVSRAKTSPEHCGSTTRSVLIVEDNPSLAESLAFALETFGWTIHGPATSSDAAHEAVSGLDSSVAILDVDLGESFSWPIAKRLRARGIPFAFLTGLGEDEEIPEEFRSELRLTKPVMPEALVKALDGLLERVSR